MTYNFIPTDTTFTLAYAGRTYGPWTRVDEIDDVLDVFNYFEADDEVLAFSLLEPYRSLRIYATDVIQVGGAVQGGTMHQKFAYLKDNVIYLPIIDEVGEGGEAARFGIEDILGVQDRAVDMEGNDLVISDIPYFSVSGTDVDGINELIQSGVAGGNYIQASGANGTNHIEANAVSGQNLIHAGSANSLTSFRNILTANGTEAFNDLTSHGVDAYLLIIAAADITFGAKFNTENLTATRDLQFPNASGVLALMPSVTAYASNALAVAAIGVGKLYKSTDSINGSPIILLTV